MSDQQHDYVALEWVKGEISDTLKQARQALDGFAVPEHAEQDIAECLSCIHQVHGSLQMVEFYGAALLAEEMEQLVLALQQGRVSEPGEAVSLLHQAFAQLPLYLDRVQSARRDLPLVVLPLLNDLRSARGESLLSETSLFSPVLPVLPALDGEALAQRAPAELPGLLRKWRQMLQTALVGLLREQDDATNLGYMAKVFNRLENLCQDAPLAPLWQVGSALVEGMLDGAISNSPALRSLLKDADRELKRLLEQGLDGINQAAPDELLKSLLFYIAKAERLTPQMRVLKERYGLDEALPSSSVVDEERARLAGPDRDAMRSVVSALCEELVRVKERLDLFVRSDRQHADDLGSLLAPLRQIADTLAVLGFGQPRKVIIDQLAVVQGLAQGMREPNDAVLMDVAGALLYVEATLAGMVGTVEPQGREESREESRLPTTDLALIHQIVIREALLCLQQAKDLIVDYIDADWDRERLAPLPDLLTQVRGALSMIPLGRAASLLETCNRYIREHLVDEPAAPAWQQLDRLADALSGIEYYLERLAEDHEAAGETVLDKVEQSLDALGYTPVELEVPLLDEVLSPTEALVMQDLQELDDPHVVKSLADVLAHPVSELNPPARQVPRSLLPPPPDEPPVDDELREVFLEEAAEVLDALRDYLPRWLADLESKSALGELRRAFHTLKGSGRMVRALVLAELAWAMENLLNRVLERSLEPGPEVPQLIDEVLRLLPQLVDEFAADAQRQRDDVDQLAARAHALASADGAGDAESEADSQGLDLQLLEIFRAEAETHLDSLNHFLEQAAEHLPLQVSDELQRALHTLKGSAYMAGVLPMAELAAPLYYLVREFKAHLLALDLDEVELLFEAEGLFRQGLQRLKDDPLVAIDGAPQLIRRAEELLAQRLEALQSVPTSAQRTRRDPQLISSFLAQGMDILLDAESLLQRWQQHPGERQELNDLLDELTTLGQGAHLADLEPVDELCEALLDIYGAVEESSLAVSERFFHEAQQAHEALINMLDELAAGQAINPQPARIRALRELLDEALDPSATGLIKTDGSRALSISELGAATAAAQVEGNLDLDDEIVEVFLEEGLDIIESSGAALQRWRAEPSSRQEVENLLRDLHTLKGGARMVEIAPIGDLAHELEFLYEGVSTMLLQPGEALFELLQSGHDRLAQMLDAVRAGQPVLPADALIAEIQAFGRQSPVEPAPVAQLTAPAMPKSEPEAERPPQDMVKVSADVLEDLVNLAGETSIFRGRIEQQVNDAKVALNEMETTIERMRDQLRRLDTETQGRILSRQQVEAERLGYEEFDPLEMDRHSQLQQLSRALFESASDLLDLKETLAGRNQDAENLLLQQARVNTELQEGLMRTRMVPFERMVPRLKRVVRQVAGELGKDVDFIVGNAEAEVDRNVLERMVAPLEHMLRNAVDHGLEGSEVRRAAGKPEQGRITLDLSHEGGDIVFDIHDDGAGVPLDAVRRKAIKRGMIEQDTPISDRDVLQFILQPGFSTAERITQISGRGVGMDVVHEEVRQLGGSMTIDSIKGQGVHFQIRLPFSVSVNRALMVQCGDEQYAVPLNTVEGLVRVLPNELEGYYQFNPPRYEYAGQTYELRYLGELLKTVSKPRLLGLSQPLPVLLVHCNEQRVALQVDSLAGTREIVVKSLGPQFAAVSGLSGATILGDGRVVPILDLLAHVRTSQAWVPVPRALSDLAGDFTPLRPRLVMVVDDSVTVRKVTSRLLERNGMNVITAKDGVDAMSLLQEHTPDLMLLDIEMPRMDGFEVATRVRNDPRLKDLPIIMITSRTGQKHRDRAMAIGVNDYLGKPYQESVLLESIAQWSHAHA